MAMTMAGGRLASVCASEAVWGAGVGSGGGGGGQEGGSAGCVRGRVGGGRTTALARCTTAAKERSRWGDGDDEADDDDEAEEGVGDGGGDTMQGPRAGMQKVCGPNRACMVRGAAELCRWRRRGRAFDRAGVA